MRRSILLFAVLCVAGCTAAAPEHRGVPPEDMAVGRICREIRDYNTKISGSVELINSVRFNFRGRSFTAIGPLRLDEPGNGFSMAAVNPMGMTLFRIRMKNGELVTSEMIPEFKKFKQAADTVSKDIERIYFNREIDLSKAVRRPEKDGVVLESRGKDTKRCEYRFGRVPLVLLTKTCYKNGRKIWSADYYNYREYNGGLFPMKTFFKQYRHGYTLDIDTKRIKAR
ncbi:MAG: DUF3261 domain-containing protein [Desulfarculaceae bacterium]|nr:DUF3261 domain-containing protein [Desulfarculaceae bacterium]